MAVSEAHKRASAKWNASRDNIMIRPDKDTGAQIRQAAANAGQSVQQYILQAVTARMADEADDDAFCRQLLARYEADPEKNQSYSLEECK